VFVQHFGLIHALPDSVLFEEFQFTAQGHRFEVSDAAGRRESVSKASLFDRKWRARGKFEKQEKSMNEMK
jgi:hypothetical protein